MRSSIVPLSLTSTLALAFIASGDARAASGGPDPYGYSFVDQVDGATYNYVDITATGMLVVTGDDATGSIPLGAPFTFYNNALSDMVASTNGFLGADLAAGPDTTNDCTIPALPSTGAGFRIYALHDDLVTDVYYQYFDSAAATAIGFPGTVDGVSVFQWSGTHFGAGGGPVDAEIVLFHDTGDLLGMVAADGEAGVSSTLGIQDAYAFGGLNYVCNTAGSVVPGVTAVLYSLEAPDSDCCTDSPTGTPGCIDPGCTEAVCAIDGFCCGTDWDVTCATEAALECPVLCGPPTGVTINEVRTDQPGTNNDEYFELTGPPGTSLDGMAYVVLGDIPTGEIETVIDLSGQVIPPSGFFVAAEGSFTLGVADMTASINFENDDTVTHLLVGGFYGAVSANADVNGDGVLDTTPWQVQLDTLALVHPPSAELPYGPGGSCMAGPTCAELDDMVDAPFHAYRCLDGDGGWLIGNDDPAMMPVTDSPGASNPCCGDGIVDPGEDCDDAGESATCNDDCTMALCGDGLINMTAGEECDDMGESAACDDDCTAAMCGDSVVNTTAGETCDDGGRSATCNDDCTAATCGDGIVNMTAGEECDGDGMGMPGETADCDDDCTNAMCGDGAVNATAGEECDDMGESDVCDDDCTTASCGDGTVNATAGEECDDGNTDDGDGCAADCTNEMAGSTGGDTGDTGDTGVDETAGPGDTGDTGGATGPGPMTLTTSEPPGDGSGTEGDTEGGTGAVPGEEGCSCSTEDGPGRGNPWSVLALFGLGLLGRRRRRS